MSGTSVSAVVSIVARFRDEVFVLGIQKQSGAGAIHPGARRIDGRERYKVCIAAPSILPTLNHGVRSMSKLLRGLAAGYGAKKMGGGCFSTVLIFILLWWLLGNFGIFK
jgi:hypothetical protein